MKVYYDKEIDAVYIQLDTDAPEAVTEIRDGINLDVLPDGKISGIEILDASKKLDIKTLLTYSVDDVLASLMNNQV
jgi:uncharacterized protein YuzE